MTRTPLAAAAALLAAALGTLPLPEPAAAQPKLPPPPPPGQPLPLKGVGQPAAATPQAVAGFWAERLIADLDQLKAEVAVLKIAPSDKKAITDRADAALDRAYAIEKSLGQPKRDPWFRAFGDVEGTQAELTKAVGQHAGVAPVVYVTLDRANYAMQQLGVGLLVGERNPDHLKQVVARLAAGLTEQAERLRFTTGELGPAGKTLEAELRKFVAVSQKFARDSAGSADLNKMKRDFLVVGGKWPQLAGVIGVSVGLPPDVRYQTNRVDGLYRELAALLGFAVPAPPVPAPGTAPVRPGKVSVLAVGADAGMEPRVIVYADDKGTVAHSFFAYNRLNHKDGVRVAVADLNGDGLPEVITVPGGKGHARVKVFDGRDTNPVITFDAFDQKVAQWGYFVAAADLAKDGRALVAVAPDVGGPPAVEVYDLAAGKLVGTVVPFPREFAGGVRVAWGDVNGDGIPDLVTASGPGLMPATVKVFDGTNLGRVLVEFLGADEKYKGGLWVAAADLTKNNRAEIVVGLDAGTRPLVRVFDGTKGKFVAEFEPYPATFRGGVRVAIGDPDDASRLKVICAPGPGAALPVRLVRPDGKAVADLDPFPRANRGVFVGSR